MHNNLHKTTKITKETFSFEIFFHISLMLSFCVYWIDGPEELEYFDWYIQILFKEFIILTNYQVSIEFFGFWFSIKNNTLISTYEWDMITMANSIRVGLQKQINMATQSATVYINTIAISCFSFIIFCDIVFHEKFLVSYTSEFFKKIDKIVQRVMILDKNMLICAR